MKLTIGDIVKATGGKLSGGKEEIYVEGVCTDTRNIQKGDFYVALKGPYFDGHDFVLEAKKKGAVGALILKSSNAASNSFSEVFVEDTLKALGDLAHFWRTKFSIPVIAVTGSSGKTTTKDFIAECLKQKGPVLKTEGNLNNLIGLPLSVLRLHENHRYCVLELGMNTIGEIDRLTEICAPTIGLITNVGRAHLEGLGDMEGVAKAKGELFLHLSAESAAVINLDDSFVSKMPTEAKKLTFGFNESADICCVKVVYRENEMEIVLRDPKQEASFSLPIVGAHHVMNWLACYAVCYLLGVTAKEAQESIKNLQLTQMRGEALSLKENIIVINDAYNANPDSMKVAFESFNLRFPEKRKIAILGEMLELGEHASDLHLQVGKEAASQGINILLSFGDHAVDVLKGFLAKDREGFAFREMDDLKIKLKEIVKENDVILVKGSRGMKMEQVVDFLKREH